MLAVTWGQGWADECKERNLDPAKATADDILGPMPGVLWSGAGKRVTLFSDTDMFDNLGEVLDWGKPSQLDVSPFVEEVSLIADLTVAEAEVVECFAQGIPRQYKYSIVLAEILRVSEETTRKRWQRAKEKLLRSWAVEPRGAEIKHLRHDSQGTGKA